jgi:hypothetical protein
MSDWFETMEEQFWLLPDEKGEEEARFWQLPGWFVSLSIFSLPNKYEYLIVCWVIIFLTVVTQQCII